MFMFRKHRERKLKDRLKDLRANAQETTPTAQKRVHDLLERLQENQLEMLECAVRSGGLEPSHCVLVPHENDNEPQLPCCQYWRRGWYDLRDGNDLRRLPHCESACDPVYSCCNPFHWSRVCQPDTPPPPYSRTNSDRIRPEDRAPSEMPLLTRNSFESLTTSGDGCMVNPHEWCKLAYWEMSERVGPLLPVEHSSLNVFALQDIVPKMDGLSLEHLSRQNQRPTEASRKTREKIKLGITISHEANGCVWVYNRSDQPVFVTSLYLENEAGVSNPQPVKVPAASCLCAFDPCRMVSQVPDYGWDSLVQNQRPAVDPRSIRISFVKGWGSKYHRREITSCPCWLEILLAPCR